MVFRTSMGLIPLLCLLAGTALAGDDLHDPSISLTEPVPVNIYRDEWGTPHIVASRDEGAIYGLGYVTAQDRLFQINFARLKIQGRLAEFFGEFAGSGSQTVDLLSLDIAHRTIGYAIHVDEVYALLSADTQSLLQAYADGVNAYVADVAATGEPLSPQFEEAGIKVFEPWRPQDCLLAWMWFALEFSGSPLDEVAKQKTYERTLADDGLEAALARLIPPVYDEEAAQIPPPDDVGAARHSFPNHLITPNRTASHAFAVTGRHTASGKSMSLGLPLLALQERTLYESHVVGETFNSRGAGPAGAPGYMMGFTEHTSWSVSAMTLDNNDLFKLTSSADQGAYLLDGSMQPFEETLETVKVKGGRNHEFWVKHSAFGPVVNDLLPTPEPDLYAGKYISTAKIDGAPHPIEAQIGLMRSRSWQEARELSFPYWTYPNANLVFADDAGTYGSACYRPMGALPIRSRFAPLYGALPQEGTDTSLDWHRIIVMDLDLEHCSEDFVLTANHLVVGSWYEHYGYGQSGETQRSWRLRQILTEQIASGEKFTVDHLQAIRRDTVSSLIVGTRLVFNHVADNFPQGLDLDATRALDQLNAWNGEKRSDDPIYALLISMKPHGFYDDTQLADLGHYGPRGSGMFRFLKDFAASPLDALVAQDGTDFTDDVIQWSNDVLVDAWRSASHDYGRDPNTWSDAVDQTTTIHHMTNWTFDTSPFGPQNDIHSGPLPGLNGGTLWSQLKNVYTQIVDHGQDDSSYTALSPGNSANPESAWFMNQLDLWEAGETHEAVVSADATLQIGELEHLLSWVPAP